jgi:hypothetical protein
MSLERSHIDRKNSKVRNRVDRLKIYSTLREGKTEFGLAFLHISERKWGGVIITKFCKRVGYVMISVTFGADIPR